MVCSVRPEAFFDFFASGCHNRPLHPTSVASGSIVKHVITVNTAEPETWFEEFCRREYAAVYRYTYARVSHPDEAQEVLQECFLTFYRLLTSGEVREHPRALLFRLARNIAIDAVRRRATRDDFARQAAGGTVIAFAPPPSPTPEEILLEKERRQCADEALARLSSRDRECLALRRSGLTYREIAEALNLNPHSVGQTISRALHRFEQAYDELLGRAGKGREVRRDAGEDATKAGRR
jgi:RNA polymerase sigma factor (sigma-70 family)